MLNEASASYPDGWDRHDLFEYAELNLKKADQYIESISNKNILTFCKIPLALAKRTIGALHGGQEKMNRAEVESTVEAILNE